MSIIEETTESKSVIKRRLPRQATVFFDDNGVITKMEIILRRTVRVDNLTADGEHSHKTVQPDAANTELTTRLTRIDNAVEWVIKNM